MCTGLLRGTWVWAAAGSHAQIPAGTFFLGPQIFKNATAQILILVQPILHLMWVPKQTVVTLSMQHCGTTLWYTSPQKTMNPMQGPLCTCRGIVEKGLVSLVVLPSVCYRCYASPSMIFCYQRRKRRGMLR